ncbi:MAG: GTP 3',8-cyclase MoaA [Acidobacteria bacterium]|nr:GTP 3',8-cyclase MoaA [Acidobacteriota bacterium]
MHRAFHGADSWPDVAARPGDTDAIMGLVTTVRDGLDRPLRSLRISVTDRCNLRCQYCMPEEEYVWLPRRDILTFEEVGALVDAFTDAGVDRVRLTGGEPLLRTNLPDLIHLLAGRTALRDLALTTNGMLLADQAATLREAGLHRLTVSLDTLRGDRFRELTRFDGLSAVRAGIAAAAEAGFANVKLDTVVIRGVNDDELIDLLAYAGSVDAEVRFIEYMDVGGATRWSARDVVSRAEMLRVIGEARGPVTSLDERTSAPADRFRLPGGQTFGIISSTTEPFCHACDRSRLTADGLWYRCLYARAGTDLRQPLRAGASRADLGDLIRNIWSERRDRGAELRLAAGDRQPLIPIETLQREPHLEMHTRGG